LRGARLAGLSISWDLWRIELDLLELVRQAYL